MADTMNYKEMSYDEFRLESKRRLNEMADDHPHKPIMIRYYEVVALQEYGIPLPIESKPVEVPFFAPGTHPSGDPDRCM